jgi:hypothetical protein
MSSTALDAKQTATLRRLPIRATEPPFDDDAPAENVVGSEAVQGTLALAFALPGGLPVVPSLPDGLHLDKPGRRLALVPALDSPAHPAAKPSGRRGGRRKSAEALDAAEFGPQPTPRALLPEPKPWAARLVQAIVEVTAGARPVGQLIRWTTNDVYESMQRRMAHAGSMAGSVRRVGSIVRSVHVDEPRDGVAEVCAVVQHGVRCRAIALRLEGVDGRWQCTALQVC